MVVLLRVIFAVVTAIGLSVERGPRGGIDIATRRSLRFRHNRNWREPTRRTEWNRDWSELHLGNNINGPLRAGENADSLQFSGCPPHLIGTKLLELNAGDASHGSLDRRHCIDYCACNGKCFAYAFNENANRCVTFKYAARGLLDDQLGFGASKMDYECYYLKERARVEKKEDASQQLQIADAIRETQQLPHFRMRWSILDATVPPPVQAVVPAQPTLSTKEPAPRPAQPASQPAQLAAPNLDDPWLNENELEWAPPSIPNQLCVKDGLTNEHMTRKFQRCQHGVSVGKLMILSLDDDFKFFRHDCTDLCVCNLKCWAYALNLGEKSCVLFHWASNEDHQLEDMIIGSKEENECFYIPERDFGGPFNSTDGID
eukprot:GEMP01040980.1.p1 GENE.GEMP01040980.1~~GEMP01040980.1.p1  ORF type:complete len:373 (+),score=79.54 GEMP01040980.1:230-1348(+)